MNAASYVALVLLSFVLIWVGMWLFGRRFSLLSGAVRQVSYCPVYETAIDRHQIAVTGLSVAVVSRWASQNKRAPSFIVSLTKQGIVLCVADDVLVTYYPPNKKGILGALENGFNGRFANVITNSFGDSESTFDPLS